MCTKPFGFILFLVPPTGVWCAGPHSLAEAKVGGFALSSGAKTSISMRLFCPGRGVNIYLQDTIFFQARPQNSRLPNSLPIYLNHLDTRSHTLTYAVSSHLTDISEYVVPCVHRAIIR